MRKGGSFCRESEPFLLPEEKKKGTGGDTGGGGTGGGTTSDVVYIPNSVQVVFYNKDSTKTAIFSNGIEGNPFAQLQFELGKTAAAVAR